MSRTATQSWKGIEELLCYRCLLLTYDTEVSHHYCSNLYRVVISIDLLHDFCPCVFVFQQLLTNIIPIFRRKEDGFEYRSEGEAVIKFCSRITKKKRKLCVRFHIHRDILNFGAQGS